MRARCMFVQISDGSFKKVAPPKRARVQDPPRAIVLDPGGAYDEFRAVFPKPTAYIASGDDITPTRRWCLRGMNHT